MQVFRWRETDSVVCLATIHRYGYGGVGIEFFSRYGSRYAVDYASNLDSTIQWWPWATNLKGTGGKLLVPSDPPPWITTQFYRIRME